MGISGKYEKEDRGWLSEYLPKDQNELPTRSMTVSVNNEQCFFFFFNKKQYYFNILSIHFE